MFFKILEIENEANKRHSVPILGLLQTTATDHSGRIVVYGDSNCLDMSNLDKACYWMLDAILEYTSTMHLPTIFKSNRAKDDGNRVKTEAPQRMAGNQLYRFVIFSWPFGWSWRFHSWMIVGTPRFWKDTWASRTREWCRNVHIWRLHCRRL